ncbi:MAG: hypothetical protein GXY61_13660 [Lentisphaerae bacterium]|nr:hypothetical protein [Lentisphaerota bacterium]
MNTKQTMGISGAIILLIGVFTPVISAPIIGSMTYMQKSNATGICILILAIASLILSLKGVNKILLGTGVLSLSIILYTLIDYQIALKKSISQAESQADDWAMFHELTTDIMKSVHLQWGWTILIVGSGLIILSAVLKNKSSAQG